MTKQSVKSIKGSIIFDATHSVPVGPVVGEQAGSAVVEAHAAGLRHRDRARPVAAVRPDKGGVPGTVVAVARNW